MERDAEGGCGKEIVELLLLDSQILEGVDVGMFVD
jgi:hypothetical protein